MKRTAFFAGLLLWASGAWAGPKHILQAIHDHAPALVAAQAQVASARAGAAVAAGKRLGRLSLTGQVVHYDSDRLITPISTGKLPIRPGYFDDSQYAVGAQVEWPLDVSGSVRARIEQARLQADKARHDARDVANTLMYQGLSLYRTLQQLAGQRDALIAQQRVLQQQLNTVRAAIKVGRKSRLDALKIETALNDVASQLAEVGAQVRSVRARLAGLMNVPAFDEPVSVPRKTPRLGKVPADVNARPDIAALRAAQQASLKGVESVQWQYWPQLSLKGAVSHVEGFSNAGDTVWDVALQAHWTLWDGVKTPRTRQLQQQAAALAAQAEARRNQAHAELTAARARFEAEQAHVKAAQAGVKTAELAAKIQRTAYDAGRGSTVDLLASEAALARARAAYAAAMVAWWRAWDDWHRARGDDPLTLFTE